MRKRVLTGIKPTGKVHLGNYLGMIRQVIDLQEKNEVFLMIANLHAQTVPYDPKELQELTYDLVTSLLALGIDPKKTSLFLQSDNPWHPYLSWILGCFTYVGELQRMHEFKEQSEKYKKEGVGSGILMYPVLMAADILLYNADLVPVGEDQRQHLELTREIARRFNSRFGKIFKIPEALIPQETYKIMSLSNPLKKMSKSMPEGCLEIFAPEKEIEEKIMKAVTDSGREIRYDLENKPGISNLMIIYKYLTNKPLPEIEEEFRDVSYADFKREVYKKFLEHFALARKKKSKLKKKEVLEILEKGKEKSIKTSEEIIKKVIKVTGLKI
jgi:tryptophanyl-tRNA synthetase